MTDEEIKAIEILRKHINLVNKDYVISDYCEKCGNIQAIETVLNLLEKKDKIIDLMAEEILYENNCSGKLDYEIYKDKEEVIKDFEKKVEEDK